MSKQKPETEEWIKKAAEEFYAGMPDCDFHKAEMIETVARHYTASQRGKRSVQAWAVRYPGSKTPLHVAMQQQEAQNWTSCHESLTNRVEILPVTITYTQPTEEGQ